MSFGVAGYKLSREATDTMAELQLRRKSKYLTSIFADNKWRIIGCVLLLVSAVAVIWCLSQYGTKVIDATGVVVSLILSGALVLLYWQQKSILDNQSSLMAIQYEPRMRVEEVGPEEDRLYLALSNGGNGPAENLCLRCDILVNFDSERDGEYSRMENHTFQNSDGDQFTLEPSYRGVRRATGGLSAEDATIAQIQRAVQGTHIDPNSEPVLMEVEVDIIKYGISEDNGHGKRLHTILDELSDCGVNFVTLYFTLVGKDMTKKTHPVYVTAKSRMSINNEFDSLVDVFQTEAFGHVGLPDDIKAEIIDDESYPPV